MKIKKISMMAVAMVFAAVTVSAGPFTESESQALQAAVDDSALSVSVRKAQLGEDGTVALLPIAGDRSGYISGLILNAFTGSGLTCVEAKDSPFWDEIMKQVEWDIRKGDMLDAETLSSFGRLKAAKYLLYGSLRSANGGGNPVYVELELHMSSIETKQHIWGGTFARRFYLPGKISGITDLDDDIRDLLGQLVAKGAESIEGSSKLAGIKNVAILPLPGDIDSYIKGRLLDMFSSMEMTPRELDLSTLGEARLLLREQPGEADALLYGAVRDLSKWVTEELPLKTRYKVRAEVQLIIQAATSGDILWSDTIAVVDYIEKGVSKESFAWGIIRNNPRIVLYVAGGIVLLIVIALFMRFTRRVR